MYSCCFITTVPQDSSARQSHMSLPLISNIGCRFSQLANACSIALVYYSQLSRQSVPTIVQENHLQLIP